MGCDQYREALSAGLDGEPAGVGAAEAQDHLDRCTGCQAWYAAAARVTRLARLAPAEPVPDLATAVLAALPPEVVRPRRLPAAARTALVAVAFVQALLAWSGALTGRDPMVTGHVATEVGAWNLALAVAFLAAASRPRTAEALVAPVGAFVAVLAVAAVSDAVAGDLAGSRLGMHLLVATGLALLLVVARTQPAAPPVGGTWPVGPAVPDGPGGTAGPTAVPSRPFRPTPVPSLSAAGAAGAVGAAGADPAAAVAVHGGVDGTGIDGGRAQPPPMRAGSAA